MPSTLKVRILSFCEPQECSGEEEKRRLRPTFEKTGAASRPAAGRDAGGPGQSGQRLPSPLVGLGVGVEGVDGVDGGVDGVEGADGPLGCVGLELGWVSVIASS